MEPESEEKEIASKTWDRMANSLKNEGYREGSSAGRDSTFQQGFDSGYKQGFEIAFKLGLHNGVLSYLKSDSTIVEPSVKKTLSLVEPCESPSRALCVVCAEEEKISGKSDTRTVEEIMDLQNQKSRQEEKRLFTEEYLKTLEQCKLNHLFERKSS